MLLMLAPAAAWAHGLSSETTAGSSRYLSTSLQGELELVPEVLELELGYGLRRDEYRVFHQQASVGGDYTPDEHVDLGLTASGSPRAGGAVKGPRGTTDHVRYGYAGVDLYAGYDTAGFSDFEEGGELSVGATRMVVDQQVEAPPRLRKNKPLQPVTLQLVDALLQLRLGASFTETLFEDTDAMLKATAFLYNRDPGQVGKLRVRGALGGAGAGLPVLPLVWEIHPQIAHRFGEHLSLTGGYSVGAYVDGEGTSHVGTLEAAYRFDHHVRVWTMFTAQDDIDPLGASSWSEYGTLGAEVAFP